MGLKPPSAAVIQKVMVVSDWRKSFEKEGEVRIGKVNASKPSMRHRKLQTLSKPQAPVICGISWEAGCVPAQRQPVYRRHEPDSGFSEGTREELT